MKRTLAVAALLALAASSRLSAADPKTPKADGSQVVVEVKVVYNGKTYEERLLSVDGARAKSVTAVADQLVMTVDLTPTSAGDTVSIVTMVSIDELLSKRTLYLRDQTVSLKREAWTMVSSSPAAKLQMRVANAVGENPIPD